MRHFTGINLFFIGIFFAFWLPSELQGQVPWENLPIADQHYRNQEYEQALAQYEPILQYYNDKKALLKAARCAAQTGEKKEAYSYLKRVIKLGWNNSNTFQFDRELAPLKDDPKFSKLVEKVRKMETRHKELSKPELFAELDAIYADDQKYRKRKGREAEQAKLDSLNLIRIEALIDKYGWLGSNLLNGRNYCWVVIQHQPLEVQKKYIRLMAKAVKRGEEVPAYLAYLQDKISVAEGKKQKYGTQVDKEKQELFPLKDREKVDLYRAEMGLGPIKALLDRYQIDQ